MYKTYIFFNYIVIYLIFTSVTLKSCACDEKNMKYNNLVGYHHYIFFSENWFAV